MEIHIYQIINYKFLKSTNVEGDKRKSKVDF